MLKVTTLRLPAFYCLLAVAALIPDTARADAINSNCYGCHGPDGYSQAEHMPSITGLNFRYFYAVMQGYRKDRRKSTIMGRIAKGYKSGQLQHMALYFGSQSWQARRVEVDMDKARRGQALHQEFCEKCHKHNGHFQDKETPPLAGQARGYLLFQMTDYRVAATVMPQPPLMQERLEKLTDDDLQALSEFYVSELAIDEAVVDEEKIMQTK